MIFSPGLKIYEPIGEGLNAIVYKAELKDGSLNISKQVAFKVLKRREDSRHFKKELSNLMQASGRRLVKFYGWKKYKGSPGLILEYIDGVSLFELIKSFSLSFEEKKWILEEVFKGLRELKESQLFHGDLSPKNIMIDKKGLVKLIDFGMTNWRTKLVEVTPGFASPLVLNGKEPCFKTDLDSFTALKLYLGFKKDDEIKSLLSKEARISLGLKVLSLDKKCETLSMVESGLKPYLRVSENAGNPLFRIKKQFLAFAGFFAFFLISLPSHLSLAQKNFGFIIRSQSWMAVSKAGSKTWCYTPCRLNYIAGGEKKILFKTKDKAGSKVLLLSDLNYRQLDQSDFN